MTPCGKPTPGKVAVFSVAYHGNYDCAMRGVARVMADGFRLDLTDPNQNDGRWWSVYVPDSAVAKARLQRGGTFDGMPRVNYSRTVWHVPGHMAETDLGGDDLSYIVLTRDRLTQLRKLISLRGSSHDAVR